ncbi:MAG: hypothetical protein NVS4B8_30580 [Herpetosiphon sp.]
MPQQGDAERTGSAQLALHKLAREVVSVQLTRSEKWRLRRLNQTVNRLRHERSGRGLVWIECTDDDIRMGIIDLHAVIAEVLQRFET